MRWLQFSVETDGEAVEAVAELFHRYGRSGVAIEAVAPLPALEGPQALSGDGPVRVTAYVPDDEHGAAARQGLAEGLAYLSMIRSLGPLQEGTVADEDWASAWRDHFHVHRPGERTVIVPSWRDYQASAGDLVVHLDPGMAFGTGLHPTTRLCIRELERRVTPGITVLDLGTGSGILALVAARLGATPVLGLDLDPVAVRAAQENVARNGLEAVVHVEEGSLPRSGEDLARLAGHGWPAQGFDLAVANLTADVLAELAQHLAAAVRHGGVVIGSGIIGERFAYAAHALLEAGLRLTDAVSEGDWRALVLARPAVVV